MAKRLEGRIAIVSGGASGIGLAAAALFQREGARCVIGDIKAPPEEAVGADVAYMRHDVRSEESWRAVFAGTAQKWGRVDILVNCAGINETGVSAPPEQSPETLALAAWREISAVNLEGTILGCQFAIAAMKATGGGAIVNTASIVAERGWPARSAYSASKAAVLQFTKSVAMHCAERGYGIRCNAVMPGPTETPMFVRPGRPTAVTPDSVPLRRFGRPEDVAQAILYLSSDEAGFVTGTALVVDGGTLARY